MSLLMAYISWTLVTKVTKPLSEFHPCLAGRVVRQCWCTVKWAFPAPDPPWLLMPWSSVAGRWMWLWHMSRSAAPLSSPMRPSWSSCRPTTASSKPGETPGQQGQQLANHGEDSHICWYRSSQQRHSTLWRRRSVRKEEGGDDDDEGLEDEDEECLYDEVLDSDTDDSKESTEVSDTIIAEGFRVPHPP